MDRTKYNGWTNYPTWAFNLWFGDDDEIKELVNSASDKYELANLLKESLLEIFDAQGVSWDYFLGDLLDYAITQIEFHELADEYWDEYRTKDEERDENEDNLSIPTI